MASQKKKGFLVKVLKSGRNENFTNAEYHGNKTHISSSGLKLILKDPDEYYRKYIIGEKDESKSFFDFGTYIHALILEPHIVKDEFAIFGGAIRRGKLYEEFLEKHVGKIILTKSEFDLGKKLMEGYNLNPHATELVKNGVAEDTYGAEINGVLVKVRTDYITDNAIIDVKTTSSSLSLREVRETIEKYDYDLSAALYLDVVNLSRPDNKKIENFSFIFTSKKDCDTLVVDASDELIEHGRNKYLSAINKFKQLTEDGYFDPNKQKLQRITI